MQRNREEWGESPLWIFYRGNHPSNLPLTAPCGKGSELLPINRWLGGGSVLGPAFPYSLQCRKLCRAFGERSTRMSIENGQLVAHTASRRSMIFLTAKPRSLLRGLMPACNTPRHGKRCKDVGCSLQSIPTTKLVSISRWPPF